MTDQPTLQPTFDIYVRHGGTWSFHNSYAGDQKDQVLAEAEILDQSQDNEGVRVMKTKDGSRSSRQDETLIWMSPWIAARKPKPRPKGDAAAAPGIEALPAGPSGPPVPSSGIEALAAGPSGPMVPSPGAAVSAVSAARAGAAPGRPGGAGNGKQELHFERPDVKRLVNKSLFILVFSILITGGITIGIPMSFSLLASIGLPYVTPPSFSAGGIVGIFVISFLALSFMFFKRAEFGVSRTAATAKPPTTKAAAPLRPATPPRPNRAPSPASAGPAGRPTEAGDPAGEAVEEPVSGATKAEARYAMMGFLEGAINAVKDSHPRLDSHGALGMSLIVGGASRSYCRSMRLGKSLELTFMRDLARAIQVDTKRADQFCAKFEKFLANPDANAMVTAGEDAMIRFTENDPDAFNKLAESMGHWQQAAQKAKPQRQEATGENGDTAPAPAPATSVVN